MEASVKDPILPLAQPNGTLQKYTKHCPERAMPSIIFHTSFSTRRQLADQGHMTAFPFLANL